jgi:hypothetical protein
MRQKRSAAVIVSLILLTGCEAFAHRSYDRTSEHLSEPMGQRCLSCATMGAAGCFALVDDAERLHSALTFGLAGRERTNGAHV